MPDATPDQPADPNAAADAPNFEVEQMISDRRARQAAEHEEYVEKTVQIVAKYAAFIFVIGLLFAICSGGSAFAIGILAVAAFACFTVGAALGFLFAIPKIAQPPETATGGDARAAAAADTPRDNTNLEQISDWFVKLLIGAGLVQLAEVKHEIVSLARCLARSLLAARQADRNFGCAHGLAALPCLPDSFTYPFCLFLIIFYTCLGFLCGYLITRLWLPLVIVKSGLAMKLFKSVDENIETLRFRFRKTVQDIKSQQFENLQALQNCLLTLKSAIDDYEAGRPNPAGAEHAVQLALQCQKLFPTNRILGIYMGRLAKERGDLRGAVAILQQFIAAYQTAKMPPDKNYAAFFCNKACYENLLANETADAGDPAAAEALRNQSWQDLKTFLQYDASTKDADLSDPDLNGLFNDTTRRRDSL